jgi:hypothetical protein
MKNKKGVEINITTIIILVLAILVLVIVALYFTGGMKTLWDRIKGANTVYNENDVSLAKQLCESRDISAYCTQKISLPKQGGGEPNQKYCYESPISADLRYTNGTIMFKAINGESNCKDYQE